MSYPVAAHSPSPSCESPSPSASTSALPDQPPRKRSRSEMTSEERKEARAHRNRIAAQNSRDRRKAQFGWLERRVAELEEENRRLRAGLPTAPPPPPPYVPPQNLIPLLTHPSLVPSPQVIPVLEDAQRAAQDRERERENEELKERIRTLERGWDAVVKALQQQGLPTGLPSPAVTSTPTTTTLITPVSPAQTSPSSPSTSSIPTTAPPPSATTTTTSQLSTGFPSPAPSQLSEFDSAPTAPSDDVSARHLARVASVEPRSSALQRAVTSSQSALKVSSLLLSIPHPPSPTLTTTRMMTHAWKTCSGRSLSRTRRSRRPHPSLDPYKRLLLCRPLPPQPPRRK